MWCPLGTRFPVCSLWPPMTEGVRVRSRVPFTGAPPGTLTPFLRAPPRRPSGQAPPSDAITSGVRGWTEGFGRTASERSRCVPRVELLDPAVTPYFTVWRVAQLFSEAATPLSAHAHHVAASQAVPTGNGWGSRRLHIILRTVGCLFVESRVNRCRFSVWFRVRQAYGLMMLHTFHVRTL